MQAQEFVSEIIRREEEIKNLRIEMKAAIDAFSHNNQLAPKGVKKAIADYKKYLKDRAEFTVVEHDSDKVFEAMVTSNG